MELEVDIPPTIVLSSNGPASEKAGSYLGQFEFDKTKNCWIQASSDRGTIKTINQYSFIKLMVMVGMSIIVLVRRRKAGWRGPTLFHLLDGKFLWNRRRSNLKHHHRRNGTKLWQRDHHIERKTSWEGSRGPGSLQKAEHDLARTSCVQAIKWTLFVRWLGLVITGLLVQSWEALGN